MIVTDKPEIFEGTWEEIYHQSSKFDGHRLRVVILPDKAQIPTEQRLHALNEWLTMPRPLVTPLLDDSRAAIYANEESLG